jgi:hypothetical protein
VECPCGSDPAVQRITVGGSSVGVAGLKDVFRNWLADGKGVQDLTKDLVIQAIRKHNYVVPRLEDEYAAAIRALYSAYCQESESSPSC